MRTREFAFARLRRWVLLPAIVLALVLLNVVIFSTVRQLERSFAQSIAVAMLSLADEKVDRVDWTIIEADNAIASLLEETNLTEIPNYWRHNLTRQTPTISHVAILTADPLHTVVAFESRTPGPADETFRRLLIHRIAPELELAEVPLRQLKHIHKAYDGNFVLITYIRVQTQTKEGNVLPRLVVIHHDFEVIAREVLAQIVPEPSSALWRLNIIDDQGQVVFGQPFSKGDVLFSKRFPTTLYAWRLQITPIRQDELAARARKQRFTEMAILAISAVTISMVVVVLLYLNAQERKLNALRSEFVANVSHELKTPLALVRMFGELLMTGRVADDQKRQQYLSIIVRESERLTSLIENVLDFARAERGNSSYNFSRVNVISVVQRAVETCRYRAEAEGMRIDIWVHGHELTAVSDSTSIEASIDEQAMQLLIINLIENALKYAPKTDVVRVELERVEENIFLRVIDYGAGVAFEDQTRIFDRFYRGRQAQDKHIRGSGIGLALVRHIAEAHGGDVWVTNGKPTGSIFHVQIPVEHKSR